MAMPTTAAELRAKPVPQGGVDPNVKIPQQILDAGKRSEAIQQAIAGAAEPSVAAQIENGSPEQTPQAPQSPQSPQQAPPENIPPQPESEESWERKFKSLAGRENAELRRSRDAIAQLSSRLDQLERENQQLKVGPVAAPNGHAAPGLTEEEIQDYGPELVDVMRRVVAETAGPLNEEIHRLRAQMGHVQQETGNAFLNRMNTSLESMVPRWSELNKDQRFIQWSQLPDIFSGAIRKSLMQEAWNSGDPQRVAAFFHAFLAEDAATNPQDGSRQSASPPSRMVVSDTPMNPGTPGAPLDLASFAAPGRAHSVGGTPAEKPVYTSADITRFYKEVKMGHWRGREQQQQAVDQDIMLAQREGRIITDPRSQLPRDPYMR